MDAKENEVEVRIALIVGADGQWLAYGTVGQADEDNAAFVMEDADVCEIPDPRKLYVVTATVPRPVAEEVTGLLEDAP